MSHRRIALCLIAVLSQVAGAEALQPPAGAPGLAARFVHDQGISKHPAVILAEDFEGADLNALKETWSTVSGAEDNALALEHQVATAETPGGTALRITATKGKNEGGYLYKVLKPGYDEVFARMYVRFDERYGFNHHFCKLGGDRNAQPFPVGRAGTKPDTWFMTGLEPTTSLLHTWPPKTYPPPGYWFMYTYYADMHSWQTDGGAPDGRPNAYYGNRFAPADPQPIRRGTWTCIEWAVKLNSDPEKSDGSERFWIDGKLIGEWAPGTPSGYWMKENFRIRPDQPERQAPFPGLRWRTDMAVRINIFKIENYVSAESFSQAAVYAKEHPEYPLDTQQATVWIDHVVLATEYIGPMTAPRK